MHRSVQMVDVVVGDLEVTLTPLGRVFNAVHLKIQIYSKFILNDSQVPHIRKIFDVLFLPSSPYLRPLFQVVFSNATRRNGR